MKRWSTAGECAAYEAGYIEGQADLVVRCKDCFYAIPYNEKWLLPKKNNCMWCKLYEDVRSLDWFCADGERR